MIGYGNSKSKGFAFKNGKFVKLKKGYVYEGGVYKKIYSAGNVVTYHVDSGASYTVEVENGANILNQTPSKDGYTFVGWRRDKLATGTILTNAVMEDDPVALYAVFSKDITLTYYNATSKAAIATGKQYYNNGNITNPKFTIEQLEAPSWESRGWATNSKADAAIAYETIREEEFSSDTTVYALYQRNVTLSYNGNGSTGGSTASQTGIRYWNSAGNYSNPSFVLAPNGFSRTDYAFTGWDLGTVDETITLSSSTTAYAQWSLNPNKYIFSNGSLGSGVSVSGASISGEKISAHIGSAGGDDETGPEETLTVTVSGIDLTNYSKLYIGSTHEDKNAYGEAYCNVGIDSASTRFFTGDDVGIVTKTITLDVSGYTGVHTLQFYLYARSDSTYSGYHTNCQIGITEIRLHN